MTASRTAAAPARPIASSAALVEATTTRSFDMAAFGANFDALAGALGGIKQLRSLVLRQALSRGFEAHGGVEWVSGKVGDFVSFLNGYAFKSEWFVPKGVRLLRNANVSHGAVDWNDVAYLGEDRAGEFERFYLGSGDIVLTLDRPIISTGVKVARLSPADLPCLLLQRVAKISGKPELVDQSFLFVWFTSPLFTATIDPGRSNGVPHISTKEVQEIPMRLPPLAEQKRIVARVDQLMALIDELDAKQTKMRDLSTRLTKASLEALTTAESPEDFETAWQRVIENFPTLLDRAETVAELRKATLELAVRGVLTTTEPGDDNPNETLSSLPLTSGRRSREGAHDEVVPAMPFTLRGTWAWCALERLVRQDCPISYGVLVPGPEVADGVPFVRIQDLSVSAPPLQPAKRIAASVAKQYERTKLEGGEILLGVVGSIGKVGVAPPSWAGAAIARAVCRIMPSPEVDPFYLAWVIQSPLLQRYFLDSTRTLAQPTLNVGMIRAAPIPLPPLAEQKRIVSLVSHLMKLCDDLEAKLHRAEDRASKLVEAVVQEMVA